MFESIIEAAKNFCIHQLGATVNIEEAKKPQDGALLAYIDIETDVSQKYRVYLIAEKDFVQSVATVFLDEESSDTETITDMALECTNLIVGNAKVLASEKGVGFTIETPHFEEIEQFEKPYDEAKVLYCDGKFLFIAMKAL